MTGGHFKNGSKVIAKKAVKIGRTFFGGKPVLKREDAGIIRNLDAYGKPGEIKGIKSVRAESLFKSSSHIG